MRIHGQQALEFIWEEWLRRAGGRAGAFSSNTKQIFAQHSSEYIQFDEPETVINAIREVCDQSK